MHSVQGRVRTIVQEGVIKDMQFEEKEFPADAMDALEGQQGVAQRVS
jgi:hypothetical protein